MRVCIVNVFSYPHIINLTKKTALLLYGITISPTLLLSLRNKNANKSRSRMRASDSPRMTGDPADPEVDAVSLSSSSCPSRTTFHA